jgi:nicotinamidase-related amidase
MKLRDKKTALLLIDLQKGFSEESHWGGNRNNPNAEEKALELLTMWRSLGLPIFHSIHSSRDPLSPLHESQPGFQMLDDLVPQLNEPLIIKHVNSAFIDTDLKAQLDAQHIKQLVIVGLTTNHCISTTTRMAGNYGFETYLVSDATATFDRKGIDGTIYPSELIHQTALASLHEEFTTVIDTASLLEIL